MCGTGTQWVDADNACVPITKYMSPAQISAAQKAGVPAVIAATGPAPKPPSSVATTPVQTKGVKLADLLTGTNMLVAAGVIGAIGVATLFAKSRA